MIYLNGDFLPAQDARVSVSDRGFLFGDGVYEVTPAYRGHFFRLGRHLERLRGGLDELGIEADVSALPAIHERLLSANELADAPISTVYLQITRGAAPRTHAFPPGSVAPTVYGFAAEFHRPERERWEEGWGAVTVPDRRWSRVDIKTINLLPNCLAQQSAVDAGVKDAILVRDGVALEGAHNNLFAVFDGEVVTHPATNRILHGITRAYVLELCEELDIPAREEAIQVEALAEADELFFTGTTTEVRPAVRVDGRRVGSGRPGPVTRRLYEAFVEATDRVASGVGSPAA